MSSAVTRIPTLGTACAGGRAPHDPGAVSASGPLMPGTHPAPASHSGAETTGTVPTFDDVYETYLPYVWRTLARMGLSPHHIEDAAQDVFIVVHRQLGRFEGRSAVKTWLFAITFRVAREWLRRLRRSRSETLPAELPNDREPGPYEGALRSQAVALLYQVLLLLHPDKREVFILGELEQLSVPEIAETLGVNVNTVASRLRTARREFNAALERRAAQERRRSR